MRHPGFAACDAVRFKQPHLRPANAKPKADRIIDFFGRGDPVLDQPKTFPPDRFKEAIRDMRVNFFAHLQGFHPQFRQDCSRFVSCGRRRAVAANDFDQRQQINRVERVADHYLLGADGPLLQLGRLETGCG